MLLSLLNRSAIAFSAAKMFERVLAHGEPSVNHLAKFSSLFEEETVQQTALLLPVLRSERVTSLGLLEALSTGELTLELLATEFQQLPRPSWSGKFYYWAYITPLMRLNRAPALRLHTKFVAVGELPSEEQLPRFANLRSETDELAAKKPWLAPSMMVARSFPRVFVGHCRTQAALRCAVRRQRPRTVSPDSRPLA
jgi:hypothetical protein